MRTEDAVDIVDRHVSEAHTELNVPGIAYGLMRNGELVHATGVGEVVLGTGRTPNADSVFRIASMTKSFTASAVMLLRDRALLRLDDAVRDHCPWTATIGTPSDAHPLTIRDLLTMQAGFPTDDPWGDRQEDLPLAEFDALVAAGLSFTRAPRTRFEYSNLGYALLGRVIAQVSGRPYLQFMRDEILEPLGLASTRYEAAAVDDAVLAQGYAPVEAGLVPEPFAAPGAFSPMGGLLSSVNDLARWVSGFEDALGAGVMSHPVSVASRREMQHPHSLFDTSLVEVAGTERIVTGAYGYGLRTDDIHTLGRFVSHSGGYPGFGSHMRWHAASGWAMIALGNRTYANMSKLCVNALAEVVAGTTTAHEPTLWPETRAAMSLAQALLVSWNDARVSDVASVNLDLDRPRAERAAEWRTIGEQLGDITPTDDPIESDSPAHAKWWVTGNGRRARLEVRMNPERPPRLQTLLVTLDEPSG